MALPHAAHAGGRDRQPAPLQRLRDPHLAPGRLLDRHLDRRLFDLDRRAVLQDRLAAADLLQRQLAAFVVQLLEPVEAVAAVAHHLAGLADIAELLGQFQQPDLRSDDLLFLGHIVISVPPEGGSRSQLGVRTAPRPPAPLRKPTTTVRLSSSWLPPQSWRPDVRPTPRRGSGKLLFPSKWHARDNARDGNYATPEQGCPRTLAASLWPLVNPSRRQGLGCLPLRRPARTPSYKDLISIYFTAMLPCPLRSRARAANTASRMARPSSISASVQTIGHNRRITLVRASRLRACTNRPWASHRRTASRHIALAGSRVARSSTSSMPSNTPRPRTSPIKSYRCAS